MKTIQSWLNRVPNAAIYFAGAIPVIWLFALAIQNKLGPDPIDVLEDRYGLWALWLLIATLSISPLKKLGLNITKWRRPLGLLTFFYALSHLLVWMVLDQGLDFSRVWTEIVKRPFITIGMLSFLLMLPLAITSNNKSMRKLGPIKWRKLHKLTYLIAILVPIHFVMVVKGFPIEPFIYFAVILALLAFRIKISNAKRVKHS